MNPQPQGGLPLLFVLMAGGGGTRLWPFSRPEKPKQCLPLLGGKSLFESTVERLQGFAAPDSIFVVSNGALAQILEAAGTVVPAENFLSEPSPRNTAPAAAFALARLRTRFPRFVMACLPSDHYIADVRAFRSLVSAAHALAGQGYLVTLGIEPEGPSTGYGYIEAGEPIGVTGEHSAFRVRRFVEKPDLDQARDMIRRGGSTWNSGMFFWSSETLEAEYRRHVPEIAGLLQPMTEAFGRPDEERELAEIWRSMPAVSLDYGILEKSDQTAVLPTGRLGWTDIGSWDALVDLYRKRPDLRMEESGIHYDVDSHSVTVLRRAAGDRILATIGLDDVIVVETADAMLICRRGRTQEVRKIAVLAANHEDQKPSA